MCSHYQAIKKLDTLRRRFPGIAAPDDPWTYDMWPRYDGLFLRRPPEHDSGDEAVPDIEAVVGRWGLVSPFVKPDGLDKALKLSTFNARSETAPRAFTFKHAWAKGQRCLIPAEAFFEPDWRSGKAVPTRFTATDGGPMMIAGLWDRWSDEAGQVRESYTMLTINADEHPLMKNFHQAGKEKRMIVVLPGGAWEAWLDAPAKGTKEFLLPFAEDAVRTEAAQGTSES